MTASIPDKKEAVAYDSRFMWYSSSMTLNF
jgi:hypothetical protein